MEAFYIAGQTMLYRARFRRGPRPLRDGDRRVRRPGAHRVLGRADGPQRRRQHPLQSGGGPVAPRLSRPGTRGQSGGVSTGPRDRPPVQPGLLSAPHRLAVPVLPAGGRGSGGCRGTDRDRDRTGFCVVARHGNVLQGCRNAPARSVGRIAALAPEGPRCLPGHRCRDTPPVPAQRPGRRLHPGRPVRGGARGAGRGPRRWRRRTTTVFRRPSCTASKGELLLAESPDQAAAAEDRFTRAIETARRQQSKAWELRATMSLARLWQRQGRRGEAHRMLAAVHATYTEGRTTPDLVEAGALLEALA